MRPTTYDNHNRTRIRDQPMKPLPKDALLISAKFPSRCKSCSEAIVEGQRVHWSKSSKAVWCLGCARKRDSRTESSSARESSTSRANPSDQRRSRSNTPDPADPSQDSWKQLCTYALRCIEAEAAESLVPHVQKNTQWFPHSGREQLVVGGSDSISVPSGLGGKFKSRTSSIIYGWPTVVLVGRDHAPQVTPLFAVPIEREQTADNEWVLHATLEPEFNLAVTASGIFDPSVTQDVTDLLAHGLPFGDGEAFAELAERVAAQIGLDILSPLRPEMLSADVGRKQGIYNAAISVVSSWSGFTATLRKELLQLQSRTDWTTTAAAHLIPSARMRQQHGRASAGPLAAPLTCNFSQEQTLERFRTEPLTIVTGPPGTGKTQLVVNAVANTWLDGDKVLITSTNNRAVDVAVERAERDLGVGVLIRTGNKDIREQVSDHIALALSQASKNPGEQAKTRAELTRVCAERTGLIENMARLEKLDAVLLKKAEEMEALRPELEAAADQLWAEGSAPRLSMTSRKIHRRASTLQRTWWFRRFRERRLRKKIGCFETASMEQVSAWAEKDQQRAELASLIEAGRNEHTTRKNAIGDPSTSVSGADRKWAEASLHAIRSETATRISAGKDRLAAFGRIPANIDQFKSAIGRSFKHLRGWACTALTAHSNFHLESGLFDLVIVDEASQCSLAAVLPLAYRARRLAVVGDPYQLNPIISLSDELLKGIAHGAGFENEELRHAGIHHKDGSAYVAFEHAAKPEAPVLLDEHYRCHPSIARWFNKTFYQGGLRVLTDVSDTAHRERAIYWLDIDGEAERPDSGSWINRAEAEETVAQIGRVVESGYGSLGVVTPFTAQARLIDQLAESRFGRSFLDDVGFVSGTAHRLQGDERDAILFSSVLSPGMSRSGARWIEKERHLVNVAVSRARRALVVLGHPLMEQLGSATLASLRDYMREEVHRNEHAESSPAEFRTDSESERLLLEAMRLGELLPYAKLAVEGYELDFALQEHGIKLNIEVDGDQHRDIRGRQRRQDITRDRVLARLGWTVLRIPAWRCHQDLELVIEEIRSEQDRLVEGIGFGASEGGTPFAYEQHSTP